MTAVEIALIIIGLIIMIGSFFVQEKITNKDIENICELNDDQMKMIVEKQLKNADQRIDDAITDKLDELMDIADRAMAKETNEKMMSISEYSDTVLSAMNKSHNEIMFLYSMLNDKHEELTNLAGELQNFSNQLKNTENEILGKLADAADAVEEKMTEPADIDREQMLEASVQSVDEPNANSNARILQLHKLGKTDVEIAKELGLGLGEVKLVIGLYKGDNVR
ncbi:hypothetical protein FYJ75_05680 [Roseburia sp. MUC/MUC-530-WT-4D]|uniref:Uncharacterized protein n=1 Tax=Roseburia porci TaxID=2605790 RepID=A0A6L5YRD7_9FIRM|nr:DUF6115 domain-containing protein [Roseburia porci]MCI5518030.1 DUF6115 domain-containing protein [Roseburia sp.]MDD6743822.1 DUF6115 domain-containing protein [Roseburia porci]MST74529.1 hypothetical protein [Roseburia porci]